MTRSFEKLFEKVIRYVYGEGGNQMKGKVYNRFKLLLAEKEIRENRRISYTEIQASTGIAASTLSYWANNTAKRYDADTIAALCDYFHVGVGELIVYQPED